MQAGVRVPGTCGMSAVRYVCDACGTESCWKGELYCDEARTAGIRPATPEEIRREDGR